MTGGLLALLEILGGKNMKKVKFYSETQGLVVLFSFVVILANFAIPALGASNQANDNNPLNAIWDAINEIKIQITQLTTTTSGLQQQVASIDSRNTTVIVNNNVPVPSVDNNVPVPNVTVVNNIIPAGDKAKAVEAFLRIDGIPGESTDSRHKDWIDVISYNHGMSLTISAGGPGGSSGKSDHSDFTVKKYIDQSSPVLALELNRGAHIRDATLELVRTVNDTTQVYMKYKLEDVIISSIQVNGSGDVPVEDVGFSYGKITWTYTTASGSDITHYWNIRTNSGG